MSSSDGEITGVRSHISIFSISLCYQQRRYAARREALSGEELDERGKVV